MNKNIDPFDYAGCAELANEEPVENIAQRVEGVSNEFEVLQGDWVQVAPYGAFPHQMGLQYFDRSDADNLVANFKSLTAKLLRRFGGLPWYEGHPDTSPKDYPNKRAYGWIDDVQARDDGLYGHVKWTRAGQELISEGHYKFFSPVWHVTPANVGGKRVLRPDEFISVGFTNMPNMPVLPLANVNEGENEMKLPPFLMSFLGYEEANDPTPEEIENAVKKKTAEMDALKEQCKTPTKLPTQGPQLKPRSRIQRLNSKLRWLTRRNAPTKRRLH
jgi:phage I-like protein